MGVGAVYHGFRFLRMVSGLTLSVSKEKSLRLCWMPAGAKWTAAPSHDQHVDRGRPRTTLRSAFVDRLPSAKKIIPHVSCPRPSRSHPPRRAGTTKAPSSKSPYVLLFLTVTA
ncbi:hypothetical protein PISMIDRAFT_618036 [Pisolithus microcarpus 441]|uniref:Uncharacterized protein n=1 Tax=Pisolithus microcarpus 441 TaxID=765257 RepID=A0A0C9Y951_9AGAM|nr:hypothetical protein PISMIDRAFT_618036 [Pisolithus microcarpus 441]